MVAGYFHENRRLSGIEVKLSEAQEVQIGRDLFAVYIFIVNFTTMTAGWKIMLSARYQILNE